MLRTVRTIAAATITAWGAAAAAQAPSPSTSGEAPPATAAPSAGPQGSAPPVPVPPATTTSPPAAQAPATPSGTPATVLDTQDYEGILGKGVRNAAGEDMGRIIDIVLDKDGRPRAAIIDFGGFLGVGSRKIAVDWRAMRFTQEGKPGRPVLQLTRNQVRVSPEYKQGEPIVVLGPASPSTPPDADQAGAPPATIPPAATAPIPAPAPAPAAVSPASDKPTADKPAAAAPDKPPEKAPDR